MTNITMPLISCLMIASPKEKYYFWFIKSIKSLLNQTHSEFELIIVLNRLTHLQKKRVIKSIEKFSDLRIKSVYIAQEKSIGFLRNLAIKMAAGETICFWDSDDLSHPKRLEAQLAASNLKKNVVLLQNAFHVFPERKLIFWVKWNKKKKAPNAPAGIPASMMFNKKIKIKYPENGPYSNQHEDVAMYKNLVKNKKIKTLSLNTQLPYYTYIYHGNNIGGEFAHVLLAKENSLTDAQLIKNKQIICEQLKLNFSNQKVRGSWQVMGRTGVVYSINF